MRAAHAITRDIGTVKWLLILFDALAACDPLGLLKDLRQVVQTG